MKLKILFTALLLNCLVFSNATNKLAPRLYKINNDLEITITPTFNSIGPLCQYSTAPVLPTTSTNGIAGSWSPSSINTSTVGTRTFTFTPNAGQNATTTSMNVQIMSLPLVESRPTIESCISYILSPLTNGNYYTGTGGTGIMLLAGTTITSSQTIYIYANNGTCSNESSFNLYIYQLPPQNTIQEYKVYETNTDGFASFDLTTQIPALLNPLSTTSCSVAFFNTLNDAYLSQNQISNPTNYINSSNPQTIYAKIYHPIRNYCYTTNSFVISVNETLGNTQQEKTLFSIAPNPVKDNLLLTSNDKITKATVFNVLGQAVLTQIFNNSETEINLTSLKSGNYFIKLETDSEQKVLKIIKE